MLEWNAEDKADDLLSLADKVISAERAVEKADAYEALYKEWWTLPCDKKRIVAYELDGKDMKSEKYNGNLTAKFKYEDGEIPELNFYWGKSSSSGMGSVHLTDQVTIEDPFDRCVFW